MKKRNCGIALLLCVLLALLPACDLVEEISQDSYGWVPDGASFSAYFIDVGQADCILLTCGGENMLIDAGNNDDGPVILDTLSAAGVSHLTYAVGTHGHEDHIGAMDDVLRAVETDVLLLSLQEADTKVYRDVLTAADETETEHRDVMAGDSFSLGDASVTVLAPQEESYSDINESSVVLRVVFGKTAFLFTGDAGRESEEEMLASKETLSADVLKVGHHGSRGSTTYPFLREVFPEYAVIQCGAGNDYGHPHEETMSRLSDAGVTVYRTDVQGTVVVQSDGQTLTFTTETEIAPTAAARERADAEAEGVQYIWNLKSKKFHTPDCTGLPAEENRIYFPSREAAKEAGYAPCGKCKP